MAYVTKLASSAAQGAGRRVAVLGAAGGIGQPLSSLLKLSPLVSHMTMYDVADVTPGVAVDLSHINTPCQVVGFKKQDINKALQDREVVLIPAGVPRKPGMTRDDLFNTNASIVRDLVDAVAQNCPKAQILIISNPVNSTVPIAAEVLKKRGVYDPRRLFGVTTLDVVRAKTFISTLKKSDPFELKIPVVGGHSGPTILPLLSQTEYKFSDEEVKNLTQRIQYGGDEVVQAKGGAGSATLSMAHAGAYFALQLIRAMNGEKNIVECTFTENNKDQLPFFSLPTLLGPNGVEEVYQKGKLNKFEEELYEKALAELKKNIEAGKKFAQ